MALPGCECRLVGEVKSEDRHPISRRLIRVYEPVVRWTLRWKWLVIGAALAVIIVTIPVFRHLGSEAMPPLDEGSILYMPTTLPGISIGQAEQLLQVSDRMIRQFPEVDRVLGKAGRAETATDPAPLSMLETVVVLKPRSQWRHVDTWYSSWAPEWAKSVFRHITPDTISTEDLVGQMNRGAEASRRQQCLDHAHPRAHRYADYRHSDSGGPEDPRRGFAADPGDRRRSRIVAEYRQGTRTVLAERTAEGYFLDLHGTASNWRATASASKTRRKWSRMPSAATTSARWCRGRSATG